MQGVLLDASGSRHADSGQARQPHTSFEVAEVDESQQGVPDEIPYSVAVLMNTAKYLGWLRGACTLSTGSIFGPCSAILNVVVASLFLFSATKAYREDHDPPACIFRIFGAAHFLHWVIAQISALGCFSKDLGSFLHESHTSHMLPPLPVSLFLAATLTMLNLCTLVNAFVHPDNIAKEFGQVFRQEFAFASWAMCVTLSIPAYASVLALLRCIGGSLCNRLSAVRTALEQGESEVARHAYAKYLQCLREAKPVYQAIASPVVLITVLWVGFWLSVEVYAFAGASRYQSIQQRTWGPLGMFILLWVAGPPIWLPKEHGRIKLLAAEVASASADRDSDAAALLVTMNAVGEQAGLKVLGTPLTKDMLLKVISYVSVVMGFLRKLAD